MQTLDAQQFDSLHALALRALRLSPCPVAIAITAAHLVLCDEHLWSLSPNKETSSVARAALNKWKAVGGKVPNSVKRGSWLGAQSYLACLHDFEVWLGS